MTITTRIPVDDVTAATMAAEAAWEMTFASFKTRIENATTWRARRYVTAIAARAANLARMQTFWETMPEGRQVAHPGH
ncbi:MAG: hypothetical protein HQL87_11220 [Magnetococcales bacterium]|nr:hypothetical protein [Magnetococcales bacterium]